ncbi:MAG TPA: PepSY domain-containing protein [Sphingomicrobium sp.]|nr:PepSY domain-containing protein [Sphingomicrobium sp.]
MAEPRTPYAFLMNGRGRYRRWHIWLAWVAAFPILLWVVSGLVMVARPIEEVRGEGLLREPATIRLDGPPAPPLVAGVQLTALSLEQRAAGPRWVIKLPDGKTRLADPRSGLLLPPLSANDARQEVEARYAGEAKVQSVARTSADDPPIDLRRSIAAWQVTMDDGTHFYVDSASGQIVATRTRWWRFYDLMWGLHIMDPQTREDTHNPFVILLGIVALAMSVLGSILLPKALKKKRNGKKPSLDS